MQQPRLQQIFHHRRGTTHGVHILHDVLAARLKVGNERHAIADVLEIVDAERDLGRARHGEQMEHGIGGAPQCHDHHHRILKRLARHDVAWLDISLQQVADRRTCLHALFEFA